MASVTISLTQIAFGKYWHPTWIYFYGTGNYAKSKEVTQAMNEFSQDGSTYKGECLISVQLEHLKNPTFGFKTFTKAELAETAMRTVHAFTYLEVLFVQGILVKGKKAFLRLNWASKTYKSPPFQIINGVVNCFHKFDVGQAFEVSQYVTDEAILDYLPCLILGVEIEERMVCFARLTPRQIQQSRANPSSPFYLNFVMDNSLTDLRMELAGQALVRAICESENLFIPRNAGWQTLPAPNFHKIKLLVYLFQAVGLSQSDNTGESDPLVQLYHFGSTVRSSARKQTLCPVWNERLVLQTYMYDFVIPPLLLSVWDVDTAGIISKESYEFLGQV